MSEQLKRLGQFVDGLMPEDERDPYRMSGQEFDDTRAVVAQLNAAQSRITELEQFVSELANYVMPPADDVKEYAWQNRLYAIRTDARKLMGVEDQ